MSETVIRSFSS